MCLKKSLHLSNFLAIWMQRGSLSLVKVGKKWSSVSLTIGAGADQAVVGADGVYAFGHLSSVWWTELSLAMRLM